MKQFRKKKKESDKNDYIFGDGYALKKEKAGLIIMRGMEYHI